MASHDRQFNSLSDSTLKAVEFSEKDYTAISSFNELNLKKQFSKTTKIANFIKYRKPSFKDILDDFSESSSSSVISEVPERKHKAEFYKFNLLNSISCLRH